MGLIKEYADCAVQTDADTSHSLYCDPAVVLAAPAVNSHALAQEPHTGHHHSIPASSPCRSDSRRAVVQNPVSPILAPLVSRRPSKRRHARFPASEIAGRRIVSMPENKKASSLHISYSPGKRVVSMPDRVRPALEPSVELTQTPSSAPNDSFGSYSERRERVRVFCTSSEAPQTPSPPSSPESLLIIATGAQLPERFLLRKYSPEPLVEEDEAIRNVPDWVTWANSPPRPIPALHGPLSLPYARCPSGAEGTIIEEPDNVAQMIWGLGPDDQPQNQIRAEHTDGSQNVSSCGSAQAPPPCFQKKRMSATQQVPKLSWAQGFALANHAKPNNPRTQKQTRDCRRSPIQVSPATEAHRDITDDLLWNEIWSMPTTVEASDTFVNDTSTLSIDSNRVLEWQIARLRQALRSSLLDMDSYGAFAGQLEPVIPAGVASGFPQSYPRIFVEPRPNKSVNPAARQSPTGVNQQYRHQQLYKQALQKQNLQAQNILPTPPDSSSPRWSSHFSPYPAYCSTLSPEFAGSAEHPISVPSHKHRVGANTLQFPRHIYDRHENSFDTSTNIPHARTPQNVNPTASFRQSSSTTLARYIKQLQTLSPIVPSSPSADEGGADPFRNIIHSHMVPTPPSPESPQNLPRGSSHHSARSIPPTRHVQRRLSSVPEEDGALLEFSTSVSSSLQGQVTATSVPLNHEGPTDPPIRYLEVPFVDMARRSVIPDFPDLGSNQPIAPNQETSPVKVRLPATKESNGGDQVGGYPDKGHQHGYRKKHRYKKLKMPAPTSEQTSTRGLVG